MKRYLLATFGEILLYAHGHFELPCPTESSDGEKETSINSIGEKTMPKWFIVTDFRQGHGVRY